MDISCSRITSECSTVSCKAKPQRSVSRLRSTILLQSRNLSHSERFSRVDEEEGSESRSSSSGRSEGSTNATSVAQDLSFSQISSSAVPDSNISKIVEEYQSDPFDISEWSEPRNEESVESEPREEESVVDAVLAFQRWRQLTMKRSFGNELKKVLDEAQRDEDRLACMERELAKKEERLTQVYSESAHLRAQISAFNEMPQANTSDVEDLQRQVCSAEQKVLQAEDEVQRRDKEIIRLKNIIKSLEDEKGRIGGNLLANVTLLQTEKAGVLQENRALLDQVWLARKDQELLSEVEKNEKLHVTLKAMVAQCERHITEKQASSSAHETEQQLLHKRIQQSEDDRRAVEEQLGSLKQEYDALIAEKEKLLSQLDKALSCGEALQRKRLPSLESHSKSSETVAAGILEHLKNLTGHMMKLESSFNRSDSSNSGLHSSLNKIDRNLELALRAYKLKNTVKMEEASKGGMLYDVRHPTEKHFEEEKEENVGQNSKAVVVKVYDNGLASSEGCRELQVANAHFTNVEAAKWATWKWRWITAALDANRLAKQVRRLKLANSSQAEKTKNKKKKRRWRSIVSALEKELMMAISVDKLVPVLISVWRVLRKMMKKKKKKKKAMDVGVERLMVFVSWWMKRVGEQRCVERALLHWFKISKQHHHQRLDEEYYSSHSSPHDCYYYDHHDEGINNNNKRNFTRLHHHRYPSPDLEIVPLVDEDKVLVKQDKVFQPHERILPSTSFSARALRTLQVSIEQELQELQVVLAKEMESIQNLAQGSSEFQKKRRTLVWEICNNLANALTQTHGQLLSIDQHLITTSNRNNNCSSSSRNKSMKPIINVHTTKLNKPNNTAATTSRYSALLKSEINKRINVIKNP